MDLKKEFDIKRLKKIKFYLLSGGGICQGKWDSFPNTYLNLAVEPGLKFFPFKSNPNMAFKFGLSGHFLRGVTHLRHSDNTYTTTSGFR